MTVFYCPIEPLESRYTQQMLQWVVRELDRKGLDYRLIVPGGVEETKIKRGQFLDTYRTIQWKAEQIKLVAEFFDWGVVEDGDKFLVGDLWFPGIEAIKYMSELSGVQVGTWGWHYAGCSDPHDYVQKLNPWARWSELGYLMSADGVFLGSQFHKDMIVEHYYPYLGNGETLHVTGLAWDLECVQSTIDDSLILPLAERPRKVIFPHRGAPEKNPRAFYRLAEALGRVEGREFVITSSRHGTAEELGFEVSPHWTVKTGLSKAEYYQELASSRVMFSGAFQETFGYCLQEAIAFGTIPVVPNRCSYPEILQRDRRFLYDSEQRGQALVAYYLETPDVDVPLKYTAKYDRSVGKALERMESG